MPFLFLSCVSVLFLFACLTGRAAACFVSVRRFTSLGSALAAFRVVSVLVLRFFFFLSFLLSSLCACVPVVCRRRCASVSISAETGWRCALCGGAWAVRLVVAGWRLACWPFA